MSRSRNRGSVALPVALVVLVVGTAVAAAIAELGRTELVIARDRRILAAGLAAVDRCATAAVVTLPAAIDWAPVLVGLDGVVATADDGIVDAPPGCTAVLRGGPLGAGRPLLEVTIVVAGGGRMASALVGPARDPLPALLWAHDPAGFGRVSGRLVLDGLDPGRPDLPPLPGLAVAAAPEAGDAWVASTGTTLVAGTPAAVWAPLPPFDALRDELVMAGASAGFSPDPPPAVPAIHLIAGDLVVATPGAGAGVLFVDGRLDIRADFAFSGLVVARGGVELASGIGLVVAGGLWFGGPGLDLAGDARVGSDRGAVDVVTSLVRLPRRPMVVGIVDR